MLVLLCSYLYGYIDKVMASPVQNTRLFRMLSELSTLFVYLSIHNAKVDLSWNMLKNIVYNVNSFHMTGSTHVITTRPLSTWHWCARAALVRPCTRARCSCSNSWTKGSSAPWARCPLRMTVSPFLTLLIQKNNRHYFNSSYPAAIYQFRQYLFFL